MTNNETKSASSLLDAISTAVVVVAAVTVMWKTFAGAPQAAARPEMPLPSAPVSLVDTPVLGQASAGLVMIQFSDFQCPFCARFATQVFPSLREKYIDTGVIRTTFRHVPLPIHDRAVEAARTAECARRHGRFWNVHDLMFTAGNLTDFDFRSLGLSVGAAQADFASCVAASAAAVDRDAALARQLGVRSTPTFLFGVAAGDSVQVKAILNGAQPMQEFEKVIERLRKELPARRP